METNRWGATRAYWHTLGDDTDGDYMSTSELGDALDAATSGGTTKLDVVFLDACLMQMIEVGYEIKDYGQYLVASEYVGWAPGPYDDYISSITSTTTAPQLATIIVNEYHNDLTGTNYAHTMSAINLAQLGLAQEVDDFAQALTNGLPTYKTQIENSRNDCQKLYLDAYIGLYHFAYLIKQNIADTTIQSAAQDVISAVNNAVIAEAHESGGGKEYYLLDNAHGISIYFPASKYDSCYNNYNSANLAFVADKGWDEFLESYFNPLCDGTDTSCGIWPNCENCNDYDGCWAYGNGCEERNYYCYNNEVGCEYTYSNRHTDNWYDKGSSYSCCDGDKACTCQDQEYWGYYCSGTSCTYEVTATRTVESDCVTCDDGNPCTADGCSNGACTYTPYCSGTDTDCGCTVCENCNSNDNWYDKGSGYSCCDGDKACTCQDQEYRDYYCSGTSCTHAITATRTVESNCTDCGCTSNNTLKKCYDGTCSDTGICNATICGADTTCDGKKLGEDCNANRKCNATCKCVSPPGKPDLEITDNWVNWPDNCTICYNITNIGNGTALAGHNTTLYVDGEEVAHDYISEDLVPNASYIGCFEDYNWTYTPPSDNITVCADNNNTVDESNETNNCLTNIWMCGDVNKDGRVTMSDVRKVYNRYLDPSYSLCNEWAGDVNCDGGITMSDVRKVYNRYLDPSYDLNCCCEV